MDAKEDGWSVREGEMVVDASELEGGADKEKGTNVGVARSVSLRLRPCVFGWLLP